MLRADDLAPMDLLQTLWRWRVAALAVGLICGAIVYGYSLFIPDRYSADTLVLVEDAKLPANYVQSTSTLSLGARLSTLRDQTLSRTRLEYLLDHYRLFGNPTDPKAREVVLATLRKRITVAVGGTESFRISFSHEDPAIAAAVANDLAAFFIDDSMQAVARQVENTNSALQLQLQRVNQALGLKEDEIRDFKTANMGSLPEQLAANLETLDRLQQQLADNRSRQAAAVDRRQNLQIDAAREPRAAAALSAQQLARQLLAGNDTGDLAARIASQPPRVRLEALKLQRESMLRTYTERHPDVQMIEAEIAALEREVDGLPPDLPDAVGVGGTGSVVAQQIRALDTALENLRAEQVDLESQMTDYQARVEKAPQVEDALRELERDYTGMSQQYQRLLMRSGEAQLAGDLQRIGPAARFRIIDPALVPQQPASPLRALFLAGGFLFGVGLVFGVVLVRETALEPLHSAAEVERYAKLPVLASIPLIETPRSRRQRHQQRVVSWLGVAGVLGVVLILRILLRPI